MTKVRKSKSGNKYIIPAEYDILVSFAPISYSPGQNEGPMRGKIKVTSKIISDPSEYAGAEKVEVIERLPPLDTDGDGHEDVEEDIVARNTVSYLNSTKCLKNHDIKGQYCLVEEDFTRGMCCDTNLLVSHSGSTLCRQEP
jgi:hypothetical protein